MTITIEYDDVRVRIGLKAGSSLVANPDNVPSVTPAPKKERWIPCSERLPEDGQRCIVTTKGRLSYSYCEIASYSNNLYNVDEFDFYDKKNTSGFYNYDSEYGYYENTDVIAWMPLPEPYNAESKEVI